MAPLKSKGDLAELKVACDLVERGYQVAFPHGEDSDFDLIFWRAGGPLRRTQVKHSRSNGEFISVQCCSQSLTNGKVRTTKRYTAETIDVLAVYDPTTARCYYVPAHELGDGRRQLILRLVHPRNNQRRGIRFAHAYLNPEPAGASRGVEPAGFEPATSDLQNPRSPN
jgi:hypothetical protein